MDKTVLDLLTFYQRDLRQSEEGRTALASLGITSPEAVEHFGLGYASGRALEAASDVDRRHLVKLGLVKRRREIFIGRVVMPVHDTSGELVDLCGMKRYGRDVRYVSWREPMQGLIGASVLKASQEIILCDTPMCAIKVREHGHLNVVALRTPDELRKHLALFKANGIERIYLVARKHRRKLLPVLERAGIETVSVPFTEAELAIPRVESADGETSRTSVPVRLLDRKESHLLFGVNGTRYRVDAVAATGLGMRVRVRVDRGGDSHFDRVDLASASSRAKFAQGCAGRLELPRRQVEEHLAAIADHVDRLSIETDEERAAAPRALRELGHTLSAERR